MEQRIETVKAKVVKAVELAMHDVLHEKGGSCFVDDVYLEGVVHDVFWIFNTAETDIVDVASEDIVTTAKDYLADRGYYINTYGEYLSLKKDWEKTISDNPFNENNPFFEPSTLFEKFTDINQELIAKMKEGVDFTINTWVNFTMYGIEPQSSISFTNKGVGKILRYSEMARDHINALYRKSISYDCSDSIPF